MSWTGQHWDLTWEIIRDIALTGTGMFLLLSQVWSNSPSDVLITAGLALTVPSVASHAKALLTSSSSGSGVSSSPSTPPSGSSDSGSSPGAADDPP